VARPPHARVFALTATGGRSRSSITVTRPNTADYPSFKPRDLRAELGDIVRARVLLRCPEELIQHVSLPDNVKELVFGDALLDTHILE